MQKEEKFKMLIKGGNYFSFVFYFNEFFSFVTNSSLLWIEVKRFLLHLPQEPGWRTVHGFSDFRGRAVDFQGENIFQRKTFFF